MNSDIIFSMGTHTYVAQVERIEEDKIYLVSFPSLKGCVTYGKTLEEALAMGKEALELYLSVLKNEGEVIPKEKRSLLKKGRKVNIPLSVSIA